MRSHGGRLIGPNCLGIAASGPRLNATFGPSFIPAGNIGFSSQSGALGLAFLQEATARGLGLSVFVSIGNKADVSSNDLLEYFEDDPATELVLVYLESFGNPRRFGRLARRVARSKPILAMKSGRSRAGIRAAGSHTAALAGSEEAVDALFQQAGVIRAETLGQLLDVASLLATQPLPAGRSVAVVTNAGGLGILCADACEAAGLELPALADDTREALAGLLPAEAGLGNPVDFLGSATAATYEAALPPVLSDPNVDCRDRAVRAAGGGGGGRGGSRDPPRGRRGRSPRQAGARGGDERGRDTGGAARGRTPDRRLQLPGVGGRGARACGGARGLAAAAGRHGAGARPTSIPRRAREIVVAAARACRRRVAGAAGGALAARGLWPPAGGRSDT